MYFEPIQKNKDGEILNYTISNLEAMLQSEDSEERAAVANLGYALDKLVDDENEDVRAEVARQAGKFGRTDLLEKLANDGDERVHYTVKTALKKLQAKQ